MIATTVNMLALRPFSMLFWRFVLFLVAILIFFNVWRWMFFLCSSFVGIRLASSDSFEISNFGAKKPVGWDAVLNCTLKVSSSWEKTASWIDERMHSGVLGQNFYSFPHCLFELLWCFVFVFHWYYDCFGTNMCKSTKKVSQIYSFVDIHVLPAACEFESILPVQLFYTTRECRRYLLIQTTG